MVAGAGIYSLWIWPMKRIRRERVWIAVMIIVALFFASLNCWSAYKVNKVVVENCNRDVVCLGEENQKWCALNPEIKCLWERNIFQSFVIWSMGDAKTSRPDKINAP